MKQFFAILLLASIFIPKTSAQLNSTSHKSIFYNYGEFNSRMSFIFSSDTLDVKLSKIADSVYSYTSKGFISINMQIDRKTKKVQYENNNYSQYEDQRSNIDLKKAFQVKFVDNRIFEYCSKKYFVYRILAVNSKIKDSEELLFWCKEFGLLMQKSLTTNNLIRYEFINEPENNSMIHHLCFFVFSDSVFFELKDWEKLSRE